MRPIERGSCPEKTYKSGKKKTIIFKKYGNAKTYLRKRIGKYCSYCEMELSNAACHVDHIYAKDLAKYHALINSWDNFLLSCQHCNSTKGIKDVAVLLPYMPHLHNTSLLFKYLDGGLVEIINTLPNPAKDKAKELNDMVGLDRRPRMPEYSDKDDRWRERYETWNVATECLEDYQNGDIKRIRVITSLAVSKGFFSVWMTVFQAYPAIRKALIDAFPGTALTCFDVNTLPINRNGVDI